MKINVLVTASGSAIAQGIIKSIKSSELDCDIITTDNQAYAAGLYRGKAAYIVPLAKSSDFLERIIHICKKENIHCIMIGTDYELPIFAKNKDLIEQETNAKVIVSSPEVIAIADDKWLTHKFMEENGLPNIPSAQPDTVKNLIVKEGFPLIIKPRIGDSSKDTFVVRSIEELDEKLDYFSKNKSKNKFLAEEVGPIIQKYIENEDEEFTSTTVVFNGKSYGAISMNREMRFGGHTTKAIIKEYPGINDSIIKVAEKLQPYGPCNFQSRLIDGVPYIFEINCRFSGTIGMCGQVGFNTVEACIKKAVLGEEIKTLTYKKGVLLRYFNEVFIPEECIDEMQAKGELQNPRSEVNNSL